jgi:hypothetical protein
MHGRRSHRYLVTFAGDEGGRKADPCLRQAGLTAVPVFLSGCGGCRRPGWAIARTRRDRVRGDTSPAC